MVMEHFDQLVTDPAAADGVVSSTTPLAPVGPGRGHCPQPLGQTLRIDSGDPQRAILGQLGPLSAAGAGGLASMLRLLASEQLAGRLTIAPEVVFSASEVLTGETRPRIQQAWGQLPFDVYAATETAGIAAEGQVHRGCTCSRTWSSPRWWTVTTSPCPPASPVRSCWSPCCSAGLNR